MVSRFYGRGLPDAGPNSFVPLDRKAIVLGHCEFGRDGAAKVLGMSQEARAKRYFRALKRL